MNLLRASARISPTATFADYTRAVVTRPAPSVNVAALVGHTALAQQPHGPARPPRHARRDRGHARPAARGAGARRHRPEHGAGLRLGLRSRSPPRSVAGRGAGRHTGRSTPRTCAPSSPPSWRPCRRAFDIGRHARRAGHRVAPEVRGRGQLGPQPRGAGQRWSTAGRYSLPVGCDCYPYAASSSTLDLKQVTQRFRHRHHLVRAAPRDGRAASWPTSRPSGA